MSTYLTYLLITYIILCRKYYCNFLKKLNTAERIGTYSVPSFLSKISNGIKNQLVNVVIRVATRRTARSRARGAPPRTAPHRPARELNSPADDAPERQATRRTELPTRSLENLLLSICKTAGKGTQWATFEILTAPVARTHLLQFHHRSHFVRLLLLDTLTAPKRMYR